MKIVMIMAMAALGRKKKLSRYQETEYDVVIANKSSVEHPGHRMVNQLLHKQSNEPFNTGSNSEPPSL